MVEGPFQQGQGVCEWHQETFYDFQELAYDPPMVLAYLGEKSPEGKLVGFIYESDCGCSWQRFFGRQDAPLARLEFDLSTGREKTAGVEGILQLTYTVEKKP